jgi:hypothetical protein
MEQLSIGEDGGSIAWLHGQLYIVPDTLWTVRLRSGFNGAGNHFLCPIAFIWPGGNFT